jgi:hypothetical protein
MSAEQQPRHGLRPITGAEYLHLGTGVRYQVIATVGGAVWMQRVAPAPAGGRFCTALILFGRSFIPVEAAEGLLVVLGLFEVAEPPVPEPVPACDVDAEVSRMAVQLADDDALQAWLQGRCGMSACCENHDGPHLHGCVLPRAADGDTHPGACLLEAS